MTTPAVKIGLFVGLNKGHVVTRGELAPRPNSRKGVSSRIDITSLFGGSARQLQLPKSSPIHCKMVSASNTFRFGHLKLQSKEPCSRLRPCRVKDEENDQEADVESKSVDENMLKQDLDMAVQEENYVEAPKIRDKLKKLYDKASVLSAHSKFYEAFGKGDLAAMKSLWSKSGNPCYDLPFAKGITGYDDVMDSWELEWKEVIEFPLEIELKDVEAHVRGEVGYVTCMEFVKIAKGSNRWAAQCVSKVFERINGQWFICVYHASPVDVYY